jgi:hypothetical protein
VTLSGTPSVFAGFRFPREVISVAVRWCLRDGLSCRDVEPSAVTPEPSWRQMSAFPRKRLVKSGAPAETSWTWLSGRPLRLAPATNEFRDDPFQAVR